MHYDINILLIYFALNCHSTLLMKDDIKETLQLHASFKKAFIMKVKKHLMRCADLYFL